MRNAECGMRNADAPDETSFVVLPVVANSLDSRRWCFPRHGHFVAFGFKCSNRVRQLAALPRAIHDRDETKGPRVCRLSHAIFPRAALLQVRLATCTIATAQRSCMTAAGVSSFVWLTRVLVTPRFLFIGHPRPIPRGRLCPVPQSSMPGGSPFSISADPRTLRRTSPKREKPPW
jgi:hypothetical protein